MGTHEITVLSHAALFHRYDFEIQTAIPSHYLSAVLWHFGRYASHSDFLLYLYLYPREKLFCFGHQRLYTEYHHQLLAYLQTYAVSQTGIIHICFRPFGMCSFDLLLAVY